MTARVSLRVPSIRSRANLRAGRSSFRGNAPASGHSGEETVR
ncbi:hypothetical protein EDD35_2902 [Amycolatopsis thermoflava]|uniref:Uncharacterized protein n=1 Tax=Amycolatopsis thermoflava TaxID=84480 RepID=A0A3N2GV95_9PSEU|nr:hypothetical protein EDD35_2902 [Amycolatopsis thermoflava]